MKIKQIALVSMLFIGICGVFVSPVTFAAGTCGGVNTSIINCDQKGQCPNNPPDSNNPKVLVDPYEGTNPGSSQTAIAAYEAEYPGHSHGYGLCNDGTTPNSDAQSSGLWGLLLMAINILTAGIGIAAVAGIVYGSILYASAGGSPENVKKAKTIIINVVIGLITYALMYSFLNFIIPGGLFA